jgi:hypothetical protein
MRLLSLAFLFFAACNASYPVAPVPLLGDASPDDCRPACLNLVRLGCNEEASQGCYTSCQTATRLGVLDPGCIADAGTVDAVHACRVRCLP